MSWATPHIARLAKGETVQLRPRGNSMKPRVLSGDLCTVVPVKGATLALGDVVLCSVRGVHYLHMIKAVQGDRLLIGNNCGGINGWTGLGSVYGRLIANER